MLVSIADQSGKNNSLLLACLDAYADQQLKEPAMNSQTLPRSIPLARPLLRRLADEVESAWNVVVAANRRRAERRRLDRETAAFAELDRRTLDDIGASDWVHLSAQARRDADGVRRFERQAW